MQKGEKSPRARETKKPSCRVAARSSEKEWELRLYVAGQTPKSLAALRNLRQICEDLLAGQYHIAVIDLLVNPQLARGDQIVALPTLVRKQPEPMRKIIGDLSDRERVLVGLQLRERGVVHD